MRKSVTTLLAPSPNGSLRCPNRTGRSPPAAPSQACQENQGGKRFGLPVQRAGGKPRRTHVQSGVIVRRKSTTVPIFPSVNKTILQGVFTLGTLGTPCSAPTKAQATTRLHPNPSRQIRRFHHRPKLWRSSVEGLQHVCRSRRRRMPQMTPVNISQASQFLSPHRTTVIAGSTGGPGAG